MFIYEKCKMDIWRHFKIQLHHIMLKLIVFIPLLHIDIIET
jgi:hypothetical protein